jgi:putative flippase GtrA
MPRFFRFLIIGLSNTLISYFVFVLSLYILPGFYIKTSIAQILSYASGMLWSFYWNRTWTFAATQAVPRQLNRFLLVQLGLLALSALLMGILVDYFILPATPCWVVVMVLITIVNYLLQKSWVFA